MNIHAIQHIQKSNYAFAYDENNIIVRVRTAKDDIDKIYAVYSDKFAWGERKKIELLKVATDDLFDFYEAKLYLKDSRFVYLFELIKGDETKYLTEYGVKDQCNYEEEKYLKVFQYPAIIKSDLQEVIEWTKKAVFYQIFVERFNNGDESINPENLTNWSDKPKWDSFYGGDLQGIIDKLDYLIDLGINAIYLTPIFKATTNHKYDTVDYMSIDKHFGDKKTFKLLVDTAHEKGIKIVLDAVFNHCSRESEFFQDVIKNGEKSKYYNWFYIEGKEISLTSLNYKTFAYEGKMPKLNTNNEEVKKYLLDVATHYVEEYDIDGWRLDVSDEIDHVFWREFRRKVKAIKKEAIIIGEVWYDSYPWLQGDQFDSCMNYPITKACYDYFAKESITTKELKNVLSSVMMRNTIQANQMQLNLISTHDTPRFFTECNEDIKKYKMAIAMYMLYEGIPCIYYGDEIGMIGKHDPDCRRGFVWDKTKWNMEIYDFYKKMIKLKKSEKALQNGSLLFDIKEDLFILVRELDKEKILAIFNNTNNHCDYNIDNIKAIDLLNNTTKNTLNIQPKSVEVIKIIK